MKFRNLLLIVLVVLSICLTGCKNVDKLTGYEIGKPIGKVLDTPNKIIIYNKEDKYELDKNDDRFSKIIDLTNQRFHSKVSEALDIIDENNNNETFARDGMGVEFIYLNEQKLDIKNVGFKAFKYNKLYFQLTSVKGENQGSPVHNFIHGDNEGYKGSSNGPLKYSKELVELVNNIVINNTLLRN